MPKLYLLLTAINNYQNVRKLTGCINDANNLLQYIQQAAKTQNLELIPLPLYDESASKENICKEFSNHLGQATKDDICLFYFAGHGGQEAANKSFLKHESDGKLEVLACYESDPKEQGSFLADKELRYLIHQLYEKTKAQIVTIFDCCHSGTNTRGTQIIRRLMADADSRNWEGFIFNETLQADEVEVAFDLETMLPQGQHLHLAACEAHQEAQELTNQGGVFTSNLVNILEQTQGKISYQGLVSAIRKKIKPSYNQNPQASARGDKNLLFQDFLGGITSHQRFEANMVYDTSAATWVLELGALNGIKKNNPNLVLEILDTAQKSIGKASISKVLLDKTNVHILDDLALNSEKIYKVKVSGLVLDKLRVFPIDDKEGVESIISYFKKNQKKIEGVQLVQNPALADYLIKATDNKYQICLPYNELMVTESIEEYTTNSLSTLVYYLEQIAYWTFIKNLENEEEISSENLPVKVEVFLTDESGEKEIPLAIEKDKIATKHTDIVKDEEGVEQPQINLKIKVTNTSSQPYYCALLFLSQHFAIYNEFLAGHTTRLESKAIEWAQFAGQKVIILGQEAYIKQYNWAAETSYLKLIISKEFFDISKLAMDALPSPEIANNKKEQTRSLKKPKKTTPPEWMSQLITLELENPYYDKEKAKARIEALLEKRSVSYLS